MVFLSLAIDVPWHKEKRSLPEDGLALEQVVQGGCGVSILDFVTSGAIPALSSGLGQMTSWGPVQPELLWFAHCKPRVFVLLPFPVANYSELVTPINSVSTSPWLNFKVSLKGDGGDLRDNWGRVSWSNGYPAGQGVRANTSPNF